MEYILRDTDIFNKNINKKFSKVLESFRDDLDKDKVYKFTVSFHLNLLNDPRFEEFDVAPSKTSKGTKKDKIYDVMSFQLKQLEKVMEENGIQIYSTTIQGDYLKEENIIKIDIDEDNSKPIFVGRGKNKKRIKVCFIVPSLPYIRENVTNLASERLSKIYCELMNILRDRRLMSEILGINQTEDDRILLKAFAEQFGELWLTTTEREKELLDKLEERCISVLNKHKEKGKYTEKEQRPE